MTPTRFGIDLLLADPPASLASARVGLVTNDAATTSVASPGGALVPSRVALLRAGVRLARLFSPEHGLAAAAPDGAAVDHGVDPLTGLPVTSLYGATQRPTREMLADVDILLFDIPDIGCRYYTYIWTLSHVMEACAETGTPLWVLDRPNPLGGDLAAAEGPMLDEARLSTFVGRWSIPVRHSLTLGELARLWQEERGLDLALRVIPVAGWRRQEHWPGTGNPFVPPSPNMPSYETALLYPGTCLVEGTNLSEGRGTALPFRVVGAPWLDGWRLAQDFNELALPGIRARPVQFTPSRGKHAGESCQGVMLHPTDPLRLRPVAAGLHLLARIIRQHPEKFAWLPYPTAANQPGFGHFDRLIGRLDVRETLAALPPDLPQRIQEWTQVPGWPARVAWMLDRMQ